MKSVNLMMLCTLLATTFPALAQVLPVSEKEQALLGIEIQTVEAVERGSAGEIAMRVAFAPDGEWVIKTPLPGILQRVFVQEGDRVKAGDPLVMVRSPDMVALQRDFLKARAELNLQATNWERDRKLGEAGSISERRFNETRFSHDMARAEFAGLRGQLKLAGFSNTDLNNLTKNMEVGPDLVLRAPAGAVVVERPAMLGDQLDGSELLVRLGDTRKLVLDGDLSRSVAANLVVGDQIAHKGSAARAELVYVSNVIDVQTQTIHVRAIPLDAALLMPGQLTHWQVLSSSPLLTVPSSAVVKLEGRDVVYLAVSTGFEVREVDVQSTGSGSWIVLNGLKSGDRVATRATAALKAMSMGIGGGDE